MERVILETQIQEIDPADITLVQGKSKKKKSGAKPSAPLIPKEKWIGAVMVVGGGIAGIQAALELADSGFYVYVVEKSSGIGGVMSQLDKTFPTNDCASCIILPKLVECDRHLNIELLTLSQVVDVKGNVGCFDIKVNTKPRYIDTDKCIACGTCSEKCPVSVKDDFNFRISNKKAVHIKYDQSVPLKYAIDPETCIYFSHGKCRACEKFCPTKAIDFEQTEQTIDIKVGSVILAPGFKPFDPSEHDFFGYHLDDVVTSLEYERLLSISGPNKGKLLRPSDDTEPKKIAWLQCVGSRNQNNCGNSYCSNVCCLVAVKQSMASLEHSTQQTLERKIFFTDLRSQGKESEKYFQKATQENVQFVRALPHTMEPGQDGTGVRMRYMTEQGESVHESFDMVVLSTGFNSPEDAATLSLLFDIELDKHHFASTSCFEPVESSREGIYVIGAFQTPKTISRSVIQSGAAAASAARLLSNQRGSLTKTKTYPKDSKNATRKAKDQVRMAIAKVVYNYPLKQDRIKVVQKALIIGGGIVGLDSALTLARLGIESILIEKSNVLGGNGLKLSNSFKDDNIPAKIKTLIETIENNKSICVYKKTTLESVSGSMGNFTGTIKTNGCNRTIDFGAAIMATGGVEAGSEEYLYGLEPSVMTQLEFDKKILSDPKKVKKAKSIVFIQCVGSREPNRPYCSRVCCIHSIKTAIQLKKINPGLKIFILYREMRTYGEWEERYKDARELGVMFIRYETRKKPMVKKKGQYLRIDLFDHVSHRPIRITADYLSLATGVVPDNNQYLADYFKFNVNSDGFFNEAHPKLKPVDLSVAGLFVAGICNYPKPVDESIEEARAAAFRVSALLLQDEIKSEAIKSLKENKCHDNDQ